MPIFAILFVLLLNFFASADQNPSSVLSPSAQSPFSTKEAQVNVIINGNRASRESREMYLILKTLQQSQTDYLENPEKFKVLESFTSGEPPRQMTQDEVALMYFSKLVADEQISYTIRPPDWFEAAKHLVPSLGLDISPLDPIFDGLTLQGNPPLTWEIEAQGMNPGALLVSLDGQPGQLGTLARDSFKQLYGYDLNENLLMTKELRDAEFIYEQNQNDTLLFNEMGKLNKQVEEFNRQQLKWNQQLQAAKTQEEKAALQRKEKIDLEMRRNEIRGGLQMTSTVLQLTGNPEAAQAASNISQLAEITFSLLDGTTAAGVPLGPLATANLYTSGAAVLVSMLSNSKGKSEMEAIMAQLQAIFDLLNDTRKEMHERFDLVDMKLDYLIYRIDSGLHALQASSERIEENLANIQIAIDDLHASNQQFVLDLYSRLTFDDISICLPRDQGFSPPISSQDFYKCFLSLENNLYSYSAYGYDSLSKGDQSIENVTLDIFSFPYVSALPRLIQKLRNEYQVPIQNEASVLNPYVWNRHVQSLMLMWSAHPQYSKEYGTVEIQKAIDTADEIQTLYGSLALNREDSGRKIINIPLFEKLKENYQNLVATTLEWMDAAVRNNNDLRINPSLVQNVKNQDLPHISQANQMIAACSGQTSFGVAHLTANGFLPFSKTSSYQIPPINSTWENFNLLKNLKDVAPSNLSMWPTAFYALPNEFLNHEKRFPGSVAICIQKFIFNSWIQENQSSTADLSIVLETRINGATVATANIDQKLFFEGIDEIAQKLNIIRPKSHLSIVRTDPEAWDFGKYIELYSIYWNQNTVESKLPTNGIITKNFLDVGKWELRVNRGVMQQQARERIQNDPDYKARRTQINETRNMMRILLEIGLSDAAPNKFEAQSLLREAYGIVPKGLRSLDALADQYLTGHYTEKEILTQTSLAGSALIDLLKIMNTSHVPLEPRNAAIDTSIEYLQTLLVF